SPFVGSDAPFGAVTAQGSPFEPPASRNPDPTAGSTAQRATTFGGRTPGRGPATRAGIVLGCALVVALGSAVGLGASPSAPAASGTGAEPSAAASPKSANPNGKPGGNGGRLGPFGGLPFAFGPGGPSVPFGGGPGNGRAGIGAGTITVTAVSGSNISLKTEDGWTRT